MLFRSLRFISSKYILVEWNFKICERLLLNSNGKSFEPVVLLLSLARCGGVSKFYASQCVITTIWNLGNVLK